MLKVTPCSCWTGDHGRLVLQYWRLLKHIHVLWFDVGCNVSKLLAGSRMVRSKTGIEHIHFVLSLACEHVDLTQVRKELCFISSNERSLSSCDVSNSSFANNTASYVSHKHTFT